MTTATDFLWSPDGSQVVIIDGMTLYTLDSSGHRRRQIFAVAGRDISWSEDGKMLGYTMSNNASRSEIRVVELMTGDPLPVPQLGIDFSPVWSGNDLYFISNPDANPYPLRPGKLYRLNMNNQMVEEIPLDHNTNNFSISPDGTKIAYSQGGDSYSAIYVFDLVERTTRQLTTVGYRLVNPVWSPDGKQVAFVSSYSTFTVLYTLDLEHRKQREIARFYSGGWSLDWAGEHIAIIAYTDPPRPGQYSYPQVFIADGMRQITFSNDEKSAIEWRP